ncbi:MAG: hypothetical protein AAGH74_08660 [Pseudomonadota bacterium]
MCSDKNQTIVDVFEGVLQEEFSSKLPANFFLDVSTARRLASAVRLYYKGFRFPAKSIGEVRPYISPKFTSGMTPTDSYVKYIGDGYNFDPNEALEIFDFIKPYLLYSHSVCFYDPLPQLLDYYMESGPETEYERLRLHAVTHLLVQYAKIADLIRANIVVPISDEVWGHGGKTPFHLSQDELATAFSSEQISARIKDGELGEEWINLLGGLVKSQMWHAAHSYGGVDLYFPTHDYVPIYKAILDSASRKYSSSEIVEPLNVGILASMVRVDTTRITVEDVLSIRAEETFYEYRNVLSGILSRLRQREGEFTDFEAEFALAARDEMSLQSAKIAELSQKSSLLRDAVRNADRVLVGGGAGAVPGAATGDPLVAIGGAVASAVIPPLYEILREGVTKSKGSQIRQSLRHHFLVLKPDE